MPLPRTRPRRVLTVIVALATATASAAAAGAAQAGAAQAGAPTGAAGQNRTGYRTVTVADALLRGGKVGPATLRWNPCAKLHYAINPAGGPAGFVAEAKRAVAELAHDTGLTWKYAGLTLIRPDLSKPAAVPLRMRSQNLQLVISWSGVREQPRAAATGESAGTLRLQAGTVTTNGKGAKTYSPTQLTEAAIVVDRSQEPFLLAHDRAGNGLYRLLLHQLGHAVGLDHVANAAEIMNQVARFDGPIHYAGGDLAGLRAVGRSAGCL